MKRTALLFFILFAAILPLSSAPPKGLRLLKTETRPLGQLSRVHGPIGPARFLPAKPAYRKFQVYDLRTGRFTDIPGPSEIAGIPKPPKRPDKLTRLRLELEGKYLRHKNTSLIYYNGKEAGYLIEVSRKYKAVSGNPPCACGGASRLIEQYQRYYCSACRKYVPTKDYIKEKNEFIYYHFDPVSKKKLWEKSLPAGPLGLRMIGVDAATKAIYFSDIAYVSKKHPVSSGRIRIWRLSLGSQDLDEITAKIPVRKNSEYSAWSLTPYASLDFRWIAFIEYDEAANRRTNAPHLKNPGPQAYFVNTQSGSSFRVDIDVTTYGIALDSKQGYAALASNQTGRVKLVNLKTGKIEKILKGDKQVAQAILSPTGKSLYILTKRGLRHYAWPSLQRGRFVKMSQIFPGVRTFLTASRLRISGDRKHATIGKLDSGGSKWHSPKPEKGFHILKVE